MDHNTLPTPQFELPQPQAPAGNEKVAPLEGDPGTVQSTEQHNMELPAGPAPVSPAQAAQSVAAADPANPQGGAAAILPIQPPVPALAATDDLEAEDGDLIEKAWIQKAKAIVNQTQNDPYKQTTEINKVKKEYIQKRYHKDVKLNEE